MASHRAGHAVDEPGSPESGNESGSSWADTDDIAEQLGEEDPLRQRLHETLDDELLVGIAGRHPKRNHRRHHSTKRVRYDDALSPATRAGVVDKEAIHIPEPGPRRISLAERLLAAIMTGSTSSIHGLTGKALMFVSQPAMITLSGVEVDIDADICLDTLRPSSCR